MKTLTDLRHDIDTLDAEILALLGKRFDAVREVGKLKKQSATPPLQTDRWQIVLKHVTELARDHHVPEKFAQEMYELMHGYSLAEEGK